MSKLSVGVIFGGASSEYEISLRSAASVIGQMKEELYDKVLIGITKDGRWFHYTGPVEAILENRWEQPQWTRSAAILPDSSIGGLAIIGTSEVIPLDAVFPVLHGQNGEDGTIQGLLEMARIPYVGCGVLSSAACMDKAVTHTLLDAAGIATAPWRTVLHRQMTSFGRVEEALAARLGYPMFVKPANAGSSVGVGKAKGKESLRACLEEAFRYDEKVIVEAAISGQEIECAVLGGQEPTAGIPAEICPAHEFYDYAGKYEDDSTTIHLPARVSEENLQRIRDTAVRAFQVMGCQGLARVDFFLTGEGQVVVNEINTLPGFTSISMYPKMMAACGIPYSGLIDRLIVLALERAAR